MEGWIKIHRQLGSSDLWLSEQFTRGQAWVDLLMLANHKDGFIWKRGIDVTIKRGQIGWSEVRLSERWKWSRTKTRHFLKQLEKEQQIEQQKNNISLLISISNYEEYQNKDSKKDCKKTAEKQQKNTNNNDNNENKNISVIFDVFRTAFPGAKRGLQTELDNFLKKYNSEIVHLLLPALEKEKQYHFDLKQAGEFEPSWKNLSTWVEKKCWEQELPEIKSGNTDAHKPKIKVEIKTEWQ